jgi:transmembrane sensor
MSIDKWISKLILRKEDTDEKQAIEQWKSEVQSNLIGMQKLLEQENALHQIKGYQEVDKHIAWKNIQQQLHQPHNSSIITNLMKVAAVLIVLFSAWYILNSDSPTTESVNKYVTNSAKQEIKLSDKSTVQLDVKSTLSELNFRQVKLEGRAYFDIAKDATKPFTVALHHGEITVLGTEFDIFTSLSYTQIYVTEGKVNLRFQNKDFLLIVGDMITIDNQGINHSRNNKVEVKAWQNQKLVFKNESMANVLLSVATYHHMQLVFDSKELSKDGCKINTSYSTETITQILQELSTIAGLKYQIEKDKIIVKSFKC